MRNKRCHFKTGAVHHQHRHTARATVWGYHKSLQSVWWVELREIDYQLDVATSAEQPRIR